MPCSAGLKLPVGAKKIGGGDIKIRGVRGDVVISTRSEISIKSYKRTYELLK